MRFSEAIEFAKHPIKSFDSFGAKDYTSFRYTYGEFVRFCRELIASNPSPSAVNFVHTLFFDAVTKIYAFERATGHNLLDNVGYVHVPADESLHHSRYRMFDSLYP